MFKVGDIVTHKDDCHSIREALSAAGTGIIVDKKIHKSRANPHKTYEVLTVHWFHTRFSSTHGPNNLTLVSSPKEKIIS